MVFVCEGKDESIHFGGRTILAISGCLLWMEYEDFLSIKVSLFSSIEWVK